MVRDRHLAELLARLVDYWSLIDDAERKRLDGVISGVLALSGERARGRGV